MIYYLIEVKEKKNSFFNCDATINTYRNKEIYGRTLHLHHFKYYFILYLTDITKL